MKNVHYDKIVAKAANMDLVVFFKASSHSEWCEVSNSLLPAFHPETEYFLCLPRHKGACLHWLNGGELQVNRLSNGYLDWDRPSRDWAKEVSFMFDVKEFRIKPKKEKRWILVNAIDCFQPRMFDDEGEADQMLQGSHPNWSKHEIEVEV
ncbi:hypothetical protein VPJG_00072 [Vibrio phage jenny 12G5]|nr:hypothetical protein VPJG_00072 [Vibrio phage jenny 12G5]